MNDSGTSSFDWAGFAGTLFNGGLNYVQSSENTNNQLKLLAQDNADQRALASTNASANTSLILYAALAVAALLVVISFLKR